VTDLSPLKGMSLGSLSVSRTAVADLNTLRGMPLETLSAAGLPITSIDALRGMPLRRLDFFDCKGVTDFSALATLSNLKALNVPAHFGDLVLVQKLRSLERLGSGDFGASPASFDKMPTVATFISAYGQRLSLQRNLAPRLEQLRETLRKLGMPEDKVAMVALGGNGFLDLDLTAVPIDNLLALAGLPVRRLVIKGTKISDLTPLGGMPLLSLDASNSLVENLAPLAACPSLTVLDVSRTRVSDLRALSALKLNRLAMSATAVRELTPLQYMPLRALYFDETKVEDLRPLARCTTLESVTISRTSRDASPLRKLPALARISYSWDYGNAQPYQSASEFWTEYDATVVSREGDTRMNAALAKLRLLSGWSEERCERQPDGTYKLNLSEMKLEHLRDISDSPVSILNIRETGLTRLGPIANCPIRELYAEGCIITDLAVLGRLPLVRLELTQDGPSDLRHLRGLRLRALTLHMKSGPPINPDLSPLKGMPLEKFVAYGFIQISSLKSLEGAPLSDLRIPGSGVSDLKPLRKMPLTQLDLGATRVTDISPVRESPLKRIDLRRTNVRDVSPLADCKTLESVLLPRDAKGIEKLRSLANLKRIAFEWTSDDDNTPALTAEQFWADFDQQ